MGRRGRYKKRWKRRSYPKHEKRDKRRGPSKGKPFHRNREPRHHLPPYLEQKGGRKCTSEEITPYEDAGVVGIVERGRENSRNRRLLAGYIIGEEKRGNRVHVYLAKDQPFYLFDLFSGALIEEPDKVMKRGNYFSFRKHPKPVFHRTFTPKDINNPTRAFEPHCRKVVSHRVKEMQRDRMGDEVIEEYEQNFEEFMKLAGELFRTHGRY